MDRSDLANRMKEYEKASQRCREGNIRIMDSQNLVIDMLVGLIIIMAGLR